MMHHNHHLHATSTSVSSFSETGWEWLQRVRRQRALWIEESSSHSNPSSAAWAFVRPATHPNANSNNANNGTGISFVDASLRRRPVIMTVNAHNHNTTTTTTNTFSSSPSSSSKQLPIMEIRGDCGKTWVLATLAARFVVATRPSSEDDDETIDTSQARLPQVLFVDATLDATIEKVAHVVRSTLLKQTVHTQGFDNQLEQCLSRIHMVSLTNVASDILPLLEAWQQSLESFVGDEYPTLLLWDGFLDECHDDPARTEVVRQVTRLVQECCVIVVATISSSRSNSMGVTPEWDKLVTHRIRLERQQQQRSDQPVAAAGSTGTGAHDYVAIVHGSSIPFSISSAGILS